MLIECAGLDASKLDLNNLGEIELNGRQIKNVIRLTQTVLKSNNEQLSNALVKENVKMSTEV